MHPCLPALAGAIIATACLGLPDSTCQAEGTGGGRYLAASVGQYSDSSLVEEILPLRKIQFEDAWLASIAYGRVIGRPSGRRQWELEGQIGKWFGDQSNFEFNAAINHRWADLPWDRWIDTSLAVGNGLSLANKVPEVEDELEVGGTTRLLYYLSLEVSFAPPADDRWAITLRIHHRSGVFGLFSGVDGGSNALTLGVRFHLD